MRLSAWLVRSLLAVAVVFGIGFPWRQAGASTPQVLVIQASLTAPRTMEGGRASLFVHTGALSTLTLTVSYTGHSAAVYHGRTDSQGRFVFSWTIPLGGHLAGTATLHLSADRGSLHGAWSGSLLVRAAPLPPLFVQALSPRFVAGGSVGIFVSTLPLAPFSYKLTADDGTVLGQGTAVADRQGRAVLRLPETYLPHRTLGVTARVLVTGPSGGRARTARFTLTPRPLLPLRVSTSARVVRADQPFAVSVSTAPGAGISLSVAFTSTAVLTATGVADANGRWVYTTIVNATLAHPTAARVRVVASHGIDQRSGLLRLLLHPALVAGAIADSLAGPGNPAPNLPKYLPTIPHKLVVISTESQTMRVFVDGVLVHEDYVTTGRPELPTVHGIFHVYLKQTPFEFNSPWPVGSPFYYPPSWVKYWMPFYEGYGLHDSPWRTLYGPGTNLPHSSDPGEPLGSHGCVNIPGPDAAWLWNFVDVGTTVLVY
ncbi:MAG TPA: L,D-transpeptidase [Chloroflexota bacterium]|jgi:lipoprotein-anchoring transpeptidase ErfK/SrfK